MYARHKAGADWVEGEEYPDLSKIKHDQSFNWSAYSIPEWARFNDIPSYVGDNYGVIGYKVNTIRNINRYVDTSSAEPYKIKHESLEFNYSHCQFTESVKLSKSEKRAIRWAYKNACKIYYRPNETVNRKKILLGKFLMYLHRLTTKLSFFK